MINSNRNNGFGLVATLFLVVTLASAGAMMVNVGGTQQQTTLLALQSARAYSAADAGIEWAIARVAGNVALCNVGASTNLGTLQFSAGGLNGFIVEVTCERSQHVEDTTTINIITMTAIGKYAIAGDASDFTRADYVSRELTAIVPVASP